MDITTINELKAKCNAYSDVIKMLDRRVKGYNKELDRERKYVENHFEGNIALDLIQERISEADGFKSYVEQRKQVLEQTLKEINEI